MRRNPSPASGFLAAWDPRRGFGARVGLAIGGLSVLMAVAVSVTVGLMARAQLTDSIGHRLEDFAFQMADKMDRGLAERYREIRLLAEWPVLTNPAASPEAARTVLERAKALQPVHAWIALTDAAGKVTAATGGLLEGQDVSGRPWFPGGLQGPYVGDVHGALLLAKHLPAPPDGNLRFLDIAAPVRAPDGRLIGVLCSHLTWEWAREVQASLFDEPQSSYGIELFVYSRDGEPLLVPAGTLPGQWPKLDAAIGETRKDEGYLVSSWGEDHPHLTGFVRSRGHGDYPGLGWTVVARQNTELAYAPVRTLARRALFASAALGVLAAFGGWWLARRITLPVKALSLSADHIRQGQYASVIPVIPGQDEVATLSRSLRALVESLVARHRELAQALEGLDSANLEIVERLAVAAEYKDEHTGNHIHRMSHYCAALARRIGLSERQADLILRASPMHDVGKMGIPDAILTKPGKLDPDEWEIMKTHVTIGGRILANPTSELLKAARVIALTHHERFDGKGYVQGLAGEGIPLFGRIAAIADVFDALTTERPYKQAFSVEKSLEVMREGRGTQFDPRLLDAFFDILPEIRAIMDRFKG